MARAFRLPNFTKMFTRVARHPLASRSGNLLRVLDRTAWNKDESPPWLARGDVPSYVARDVKPDRDRSSLSFYFVSDNADEAVRAVMAIAGNGSNKKFGTKDYKLFSVDQVLRLKVGTLVETDGNCGDPVLKKRHCQLELLSMRDLAAVAELFFYQGEWGPTVYESDVRRVFSDLKESWATDLVNKFKLS